MALGCIDDAPINFDVDPSCEDCGGSYCALVEQGDTTSIQVNITDLNAVDLMPNGTFSNSTGWTLDPDWTISGGVLNYSGNALADTADIDLAQTLVAGYYRVQFKLTAVSVLDTELTINMGGELVSLLILSGMTAGDYTINLFTYISAPVSDVFQFSAASPTSDSLTIDDLKVCRLSEVGFEVQDCDTGSVYYTETDGTSVTYVETGNKTLTAATSPDIFANAAGRAQIDLDWDTYALNDGCYCICLKDTADMEFNYLVNGVFDDADGWTFNNVGPQGWGVSGGELVHAKDAGAGFQDTAETTLITPLEDGECYVLSFDYDSDNGTVFEIRYDTATTTDQLLIALGLPLGAGSYSLDLSTLGNPLITKLILEAESDAEEFSLDNLVIKKGADCVDCICTSTCISLKADHDGSYAYGCNLLLTATNDVMAFGFDFANFSLTQTVRAFGKLGRPTFTSDREEYVLSSGSRRLTYAQVEKVEELRLADLPEWMHSCIAKMLECKTFKIDGVEYAKASDYLPNWRKSSNLASVTIQVAKVAQNRFNQGA